MENRWWAAGSHAANEWLVNFPLVSLSPSRSAFTPQLVIYRGANSLICYRHLIMRTGK